MDDQKLAEYALRAYTEKTHDVGGTEALVEHTEHGTVIAFRGTEEAEDFVTDIRALPWYSTKLGAWCHAGFLKSVRPLFGKIKHRESVYLTGHSLGGALAQIYAAYLVTEGYKPFLTTFGAPRAGMQGLCDISSQCEGKRYVRDGDTVPHVPVHIPLLFPYEHDRPETTLKGAAGVFDDHGMLGYLSEV